MTDADRQRWADQTAAAARKWTDWKRYRGAVTLIDQIPAMLARIDAGDAAVRHLAVQNKALPDALHAAGGDPAGVLSALAAAPAEAAPDGRPAWSAEGVAS